MDEKKMDKLGDLPLVVEVLEAHPNFIQFNEAELKVFSKYCKGKKLSSGEMLFNEGEAGTSMFIVKTGAVKVLKMGFLGEAVIANINPGEFVGEMAVIDGSIRSASAKAAMDTELFELTKEKFDLLKKENPLVALKIMDLLLRLLSLRLRTTTLKMLKK